ncbi:MAG TPA: ATP synthase F0 subunit C [Candidatus Saccharimonadales bacterium]|nr:ATP synthase F0 subunit C [Candidatus Saccharimonadales bacterium]
MFPVATLASTVSSPEAMQTIAHGIMIGAGFIGPTIGIGLVGANYLQAVGRNPEASKFLGQALVFVGLIEVYGLLAFASTFFVK